ncbi:MAG: hypothetical protein PUC00_02570 [Clostridiales bacterium]|nr:hypothetical protein [Clostridiales bacterium]
MEMSKELQRFLEDVKADRNLYRKAEVIGRRMLKEGSKDSSNELLSKAVAELGYSITAAELERAEAAAEEVDDNQLEGVSGGDGLPANDQFESCNLSLVCKQHLELPDEYGNYDVCHRYPTSN